LDPAPLKFSWERFSAIAEELLPLFVKHWREVGTEQDRIPLDVDVRRLLNDERNGRLGVVAARHEGKLVGYVVILMGPHPHHASTHWAQFDGFWLDPAFRRGLAGYRMLRGAVAAARKKGAKVLTTTVPQHFENGRLDALFKRMGFGAPEIMYRKVL
jgi:GNAT superfamily N-acetyltransferase